MCITDFNLNLNISNPNMANLDMVEEKAYIKRCMKYLEDLGRYCSDNYEEIINDAHFAHYCKVCKHKVFDRNRDQYWHTYETGNCVTLDRWNWNEKTKKFDEDDEGEEDEEQQVEDHNRECAKLFARYGCSSDVGRYNNAEGFNLDSKECVCEHTFQIDG